MPCEPSFHDGRRVPATMLVRAVDLIDTPSHQGTIFQSRRSIDARMFACCSDHIEAAIKYVMESNSVSRVIVQRYSEEK